MNASAGLEKEIGGPLAPLHHAYCIEGDAAAARSGILAFLENEFGMKVRGNPDLVDRRFESFGIDDARELKELAENRSFGGKKKVFIIETSTMTREAQNSLLKTFEDPAPDTHFFLIVPRAAELLPTLRSRLFAVRRSGSGRRSEEAETFLAAGKSERLRTVQSLSAEISGGKKEKAEAAFFVEGLLETLHRRFALRPEKEAAERLGRLEQCRSYLADRSASVKMILEYLALTL